MGPGFRVVRCLVVTTGGMKEPIVAWRCRRRHLPALPGSESCSALGGHPDSCCLFLEFVELFSLLVWGFQWFPRCSGERAQLARLLRAGALCAPQDWTSASPNWSFNRLCVRTWFPLRFVCFWVGGKSKTQQLIDIWPRSAVNHTPFKNTVKIAEENDSHVPLSKYI